MTVQNDLAALRDIPLFAALPPGALDEIYRAAASRVYAAGSFLFYQDDPAEQVFVLAEGRVKLYQLTPEGQQVNMRVATPWTMVAAIALVEQAVYPISAQAAEDSRLLVWTQAGLLAMIQRYPVMALNALRILANHVREAQDRYRELATERVERRLARTILRLAGQAGRKTEAGVLLDLPLTRQDLAEMCGTTLFTVSRILSQWEAQGLVKTAREQVIISFPHGLVRIAEDLPVNNPD